MRVPFTRESLSQRWWLGQGDDGMRGCGRTTGTGRVVQPVATLGMPSASAQSPHDAPQCLVLPHACGPITKLIAKAVAEGLGGSVSDEFT